MLISLTFSTLTIDPTDFLPTEKTNSCQVDFSLIDIIKILIFSFLFLYQPTLKCLKKIRGTKNQLGLALSSTLVSHSTGLFGNKGGPRQATKNGPPPFTLGVQQEMPRPPTTGGPSDDKKLIKLCRFLILKYNTK